MCNAGFAFPHDDGASAPPILGTELVLTAFWVMLDDAMRQHKRVYRTGYFDVVLQGMLHKSRVQVSPLLASLAGHGYQALSA